MAMMMLGERRTVGRIMAVLTGFAGTIIIIRPTIDGFDLYLLTGFFAAVGLALRDLSVRLVPPDMPIAGLSFYGAVAVACTGFIMMMIEGGGTMPDGWPLVYAIIMVMLAAAGLWGIALSLRLADISAISPFRYSRIIFGIVIGITVFSEQIDSFMIAGSVLILGAGLYSWYSETRADAP
ncbi:MAG: DMT family transporter, partial [Candidatus Puniceispirillaceae bacterium]